MQTTLERTDHVEVAKRIWQNLLHKRADGSWVDHCYELIDEIQLSGMSLWDFFRAHLRGSSSIDRDERFFRFVLSCAGKGGV